MCQLLRSLALIVLLVYAFAQEPDLPASRKGDLHSGIHLPIHRRGKVSRKRSDTTTAIAGIGDNLDVTYNVVIRVGQNLAPVIIDTGSSDLWVMSDGCRERCPASKVPLYSQATLTPAGQNVRLLYGDSRTGTHAAGPIGSDTVSIAGLSVPDQYFAAVVDTNTTVLDTGSAGILGLGFPPISLIWRQLSALHLNQTMPPYPKRSSIDLDSSDVSPSIDYSQSSGPRPKREDMPPQFASAIDTFSTLGPLLTRLVTWKLLDRPLVVTTLQRDTISLSGNDGTLSLGALPFGLSDAELAWVPVRSYAVSEGGLPPPPDAPNETYPLVWEIPLDDVYFDGVKLPHSALSPPSISLSALVDTGNSLIRGPQDVINSVYSRLGLDAKGTFDCYIPHNLTFEIGGRGFTVDPRDFAHPAPVTPGTVYPNEVARCTPALAETDPPGEGGFLYSWSLGDPFLKSTMVAFYYGNMTHPSQDPARVGLMTLVPPDAGYALEQAVDDAIANGGVFLSTSEPPPYATPARLVNPMTMANAVPQATQGSRSHKASSGAAQVAAAKLWIVALIATFSAGFLRVVV